MSTILAVAESVWRRILRLKVVYFLVACAILLIAISVLYKYLMAFEHEMLMVDVSLLLTSIAGLLCVLALAFDIPRELREGSATTLLSKPLGRTQYLLGKFVGIVMVGIVVTGLISLGFIVVHKIAYDSWAVDAIYAHLLTVWSVIPMAGVALFFASILSEAAAAILTFISIFLFSSLGMIPGLSKATIFYGGIIPDLGLLNLRAVASHSVRAATETANMKFEITFPYVLLALLWAVLYSGVLVSVTGFIFNRRDLK